MFPWYCNCCEVPVACKDKNAKSYHLHRFSKRNLKLEMPPKRAKIAHRVEITANEMFEKDLQVLHEADDSNQLSETVKLLRKVWEKNGFTQEIRTICKAKIEEWNDEHKDLREEVAMNYEASTREEQKFCRDLREKTPSLCETVVGGVRTPAQPATYHLTDDDLHFLLADQKNRIKAIEYEILRREFEKDKTIYAHIYKTLAPKKTGINSAQSSLDDDEFADANEF